MKSETIYTALSLIIDLINIAKSVWLELLINSWYSLYVLRVGETVQQCLLIWTMTVVKLWLPLLWANKTRGTEYVKTGMDFYILKVKIRTTPIIKLSKNRDKLVRKVLNLYCAHIVLACYYSPLLFFVS